jgi:signal transduction histidine kinase
MHPEPIDEAICDVVDLLRPHAELKGIALRAELDRSVRGLVVTDINRLKQVFVNLIGNAIKFTHQGEVVVEMICRSVSQGKICLHFEVHDTGIGIPEDKFHKLFQSFSQVDASISKNFGEQVWDSPFRSKSSNSWAVPFRLEANWAKELLSSSN